MIPYYILAIEDETDRAYMTALFFQYQKLMYSTIQKVTNDHWLIDDIFQTSFEHLIGKIDLLKDLDRNRLVNYLIVTCRNTAYNMCRSYSAHITEDHYSKYKYPDSPLTDSYFRYFGLYYPKKDLVGSPATSSIYEHCVNSYI